MTILATAAPRPVTRPAPRSGRRHRWLRPVLAAGVAGLVATQLPSVLSSVTAAARAAVGASPLWLALGLLATVASMVAFGAVRRRTLAAAGARLSLARATAVSYEAGAVHLTAPAGTVFSTAYAFRRLRGLGLAPAAVTFSLAVSGVVSTIALAGLAVTGIVAGSASWWRIVPGVAGAVALALAAGWAVRHPEAVTRLTERGLRAVNRLLRRSPESGVVALRAAVADLASVRPTRRDWVGTTVAATLNWLLDLLCLWACAHAVGISVHPLALLGYYALAMAGAGASPLPGGIGIVDGVLLVGLTATGAPVALALGAVLLYRLVSNGSVIALGWSTIAGSSARRRRAAVTW